MSKLGKRLIKAAREAIAIARGEKKPARVYVPAGEKSDYVTRAAHARTKIAAHR
jgi:hypothetical protein